MNEIQQEYMQACAELGNIEYQVSMLQEDVEALEYRAEKVRNKLKAINKRGADAAKAASEQPSEAPAAAPEVISERE